MSKEDFELLKAEAENGDVASMYNLGVCYGQGHGVEEDYEKAFYWYNKAADGGDARAQNCIGVCYYFEHIVEQDYEKAFY